MTDEMLQEARARRDAAWARFNGHKEALQTGLAEKSIPARIKDAAMDRVIDTVDEAKTIAKNNVPVIGGTLALLAAWFFRRRLINLIKNHFAASEADEDVT